MTIFKPNGDIIIDASVSKVSTEKNELMVEHYVFLSFESTKHLSLPIGSYVKHNEDFFFIMDKILPEKLRGKRGYKYEIKFYSRQHEMKNRVVKWLSSSRKETTFVLTTTISELANLIVENMKSSTNYLWVVGELPEDTTSTKKISFDGISCWDGVDNIAKEFGVEWWCTYIKNSVQLNFGKLAKGDYEEFREGDVVTSFPAYKGIKDYGTRFFIFGGSRNIPNDYYTSELGGVTNHISEKRLHLPNGLEYIDAVDNLSSTEIIEKTVRFDDIFPKSTETITDVQVVDRQIVEGETNKAYIITVGGSNYIPTDDSIVDAEIGAMFTSGSLKGREFVLTGYKKGVNFDKTYEIVAQTESAGGEDVIVVPNEYICPAIGDTFVLTGIKLPEGNIKAAEDELLAEGQKYVAENSSDTNVYDCPTNPVFCKAYRKDYGLGQRVRLIGGIFGERGRASRIQGYEKKLYNPYEATYSVGDNRKFTRYGAVLLAANTGLLSRVSTLKAAEKGDSSQLLIVHRMALQSQEAAAEAKTTALKVSDGLSANEKTLYSIDKRLKEVEANTNSTDVSALKLQVESNTQLLTALNEVTIPNMGEQLLTFALQLSTTDARVENIENRVTNIENTARVVVVTPNQK